MKVVYFDCFSGISGDMALASLVDTGANIDYIESELKKLEIEPFTIQYQQVVKKGVTALKIDVLLDTDLKNDTLRSYIDIIKMIEDSDLADEVKAKSKKIFENIGMAEAKVHNLSLNNVFFHKNEALNLIINIIGFCLAIEDLGIKQIYASPVPLGSGQIKIEDGIYPIPTPATLEILKGIPIRSCRINSEMTTLSGAGILAALANSFEGYPSMTVEKIGYGAGAKDFDDRPNVLRAVTGTIYELHLSEPHFQVHEDYEHHEHQHPHAIK